MRHLQLTVLASALLAAPVFAATPTTWTTNIDAATYGTTGSITFNDWGYKGPTGVGASDFQVGSGFDASHVGQIQHVVTKSPDWLTPDAPQTVHGDFTNPNTYQNANMDGQVNFYGWAYTTPAGSTFNNMKIDTAGNYHVAKNDMAFGFYNEFDYKNGSNPVQVVNSTLNFQPMAISDAKGWCGSVLASSPDAQENMAGQVAFDFAFKVYFDTGSNSAANPGSYSSTEIVPGFVMRSYGSYDVNVGGGVQHFTGSAVENNTNPLTGQLDPAFHDQVSFLGAGVIPLGAWVLNDGTANVQVVAAGTPGATWHANVFHGYAFLLRADATRSLDYVNPAGWSNYATPAPEPSSYALMAAGMGLVGWRARRRAKPD